MNAAVCTSCPVPAVTAVRGVPCCSDHVLDATRQAQQGGTWRRYDPAPADPGLPDAMRWTPDAALTGGGAGG